MTAVERLGSGDNTHLASSLLLVTLRSPLSPLHLISSVPSPSEPRKFCSGCARPWRSLRYRTWPREVCAFDTTCFSPFRSFQPRTICFLQTPSVSTAAENLHNACSALTMHGIGTLESFRSCDACREKLRRNPQRRLLAARLSLWRVRLARLAITPFQIHGFSSSLHLIVVKMLSDTCKKAEINGAVKFMRFWKTHMRGICPMDRFLFSPPPPPSPHYPTPHQSSSIIIFLPVLIRPIQVLLGRRVVTIVCLMVDFTNAILFSLVVDAESSIT